MGYKMHFMKKIFLFSFFAIGIASQAQVYRDRIGFTLESIADINIGWMKIYKHPTPAKGKTLGNRTYSAKQIGYSQQFVEWMQQSYLPKGCLGDAGYYQNAIPKFSGTNSRLGNAINQHLAALPHMYGAFSKMYMFLKKDATGKFVPQNSLGDYWQIEANQLQYISEPVSFISSTEEYYFILPDFKHNSKGYNTDDKAKSNLLGFDNHKNIKGYKHFFIPPKASMVAAQYVVIMTKDNEALPFEKVTIGEFFTQAEKQFSVWQKVDPTSAENFALAQKNLARLKEKYKNKWNDIAELQLGTQINLYSFVNAKEDYDDMFDNKETQTTFPILKVKETARELCKTDQPQWLVIRWEWGMDNQPYYLHLHESILNNFNFDYVYDYFFNPGKVKGITYKPLRSSTYKEPAVPGKASDASNAAATDKNIFFFEDFSTGVIGKSAIGWNSNLVNGVKAVLSESGETEGNWITLKGHTISPGNLKNPLPQNFEISFDIVAPKDFIWGAKRLDMILAKENSSASSLRFSIKPGTNGQPGETQVENNFGNGYATGTKWYSAPGFSNDKKINKAKVAIQKNGEALQVFVNNEKIADYPKAMPANTQFSFLQFSHGRSDAETEKYLLSNIKITKL